LTDISSLITQNSGSIRSLDRRAPTEYEVPDGRDLLTSAPDPDVRAPAFLLRAGRSVAANSGSGVLRAFHTGSLTRLLLGAVLRLSQSVEASLS
jgi:hypothetical protein